VFALGIVAYELSTGTRLFQRTNELFTMRAIVDGKFIPPTSIQPDFPSELSGVIMRALARIAHADRAADAPRAARVHP
jgi:serine/threonine-protein kinase